MDIFTSEDCRKRREPEIRLLAEHEIKISSLANDFAIIKELTNELKILTGNQSVIIEKMNYHKEKLDEQGERINALEQVPKMRWNAVIQAIISVVIGSVLTLGIQNILVR
ncbi:MAG: hypothetical protein HXL94_00120 [[Eubacterium] sulci]|nr:hypothetical protein [[Eubacterium] sulci]